ncbi:MAG: sporulation integral membrane protein YtvI [Clostridia bacterium]|nr:sporulation integral membrane protein YtvI [Clostridia bacterium]
MDNIIEKRRATLINAAYIALVCAVIFFVCKYTFGLLLPFVFAFCVATLLQKPVNFITKKTPIKRSLAGALSVFLLIGIVVFILVFAGVQLFAQIRGFVDYLIARLHNISQVSENIKVWILNVISFLPESLRQTLNEQITVFFDEIITNGFENISISSIGIDWGSLISKGGIAIKDTVVQIPSVLIACIISVIACVFMTSDYNRIKYFILNQFSDEHRKKLVMSKKLAEGTLKKMIKAYSLIILITTAEMLTGLTILKIIGVFNSEFIIVISIGIAIIDIIPVLGTGTVLVPWAIYSLITGKIGMGVGLLVIYAVVTVLRQIIEPKLVAGQVGLPPIVTIIAMYVGTKTIGVLGFFVLPFAVIVIKELNDNGIIRLFRTSKTEAVKTQNDEKSSCDTAEI